MYLNIHVTLHTRDQDYNRSCTVVNFDATFYESMVFFRLSDRRLNTKTNLQTIGKVKVIFYIKVTLIKGTVVKPEPWTTTRDIQLYAEMSFVAS